MTSCFFIGNRTSRLLIIHLCITEVCYQSPDSSSCSAATAETTEETTATTTAKIMINKPPPNNKNSICQPPCKLLLIVYTIPEVFSRRYCVVTESIVTVQPCLFISCRIVQIGWQIYVFSERISYRILFTADTSASMELWIISSSMPTPQYILSAYWIPTKAAASEEDPMEIACSSYAEST